MHPIPVIQELAFAISAQSLNPTLLTIEFLKGSGIIPTDWELAQPPQLNSQTAYIAFTNGINLSTHFDTIAFSENIQGKTIEDLKIPGIVRKYLELLPNLGYQKMSINPSSFFTLSGADSHTNHHYIVTNLLTPGAWQEASYEPLRATLNLAYTLAGGQPLNLKIDDVQLRLEDNSPQPAILFSGNFPYEIVGDTPSQRLQHLSQLIENWQKDLESYREIVSKFLVK